MRIQILIFLLFITQVFSQLPILYTKDQYKNKRNILNGYNTKQFKGGIYVLGRNRNNQYIMTNVHKHSDPNNYFKRNANLNPTIPAFNPLGGLYTKKRNGEYGPILKKDGYPTTRYKGGIYFEDANGREHNVHKRPKHGYFKAPKRRRRPKVNVQRPITQPIIQPQVIIQQQPQPYIQLPPLRGPPLVPQANQVLGRRRRDDNDLIQQNQIRQRNN
jgi:hypothetical protein